MSLSISASDVEEIKEREAAVIAGILRMGGDVMTLHSVALAFDLDWQNILDRQLETIENRE